jgi:hypothetical protein
MARKSERQALVTLLATNTTLQAVYDHEVKDFRRVSPVAMVHSDGTQLLDRDPDYNYAFIISLWWKRDSDGGDTEDDIDDLSEEIFTLLHTRRDLIFDNEFTRLDYPIVDGIMYRRERIRVIL